MPEPDSAADQRRGLRRGVGPVASFAAGFSFVSILTTVFQLFGMGFGFGGAAFFWTWPAVFVGQILVAPAFAELVARYPVSGAIFQWSSRLAGTDLGWFTGWIMVVGQIVAVAVAAIAMQTVLPGISPHFQLIGGSGANADPTSATGAQNAVVLGLIVIVLSTVINAAGVRLMSLFNSIGVTLEILGVIALVIVFFARAHRSPTVVFTTEGAGHGSYLPLWLASSLVAAYVLVGFDSAGELSEETHHPRNTTPRTIVRAMLASGLGGLLLLLGGLIAAPSLSDGRLSHQGLAWVILDALGETGGRVMLAAVAMGIFACTLAVQAAGSRMLFSMAREGTLPFSGHLTIVSERCCIPVVSVVVVGAGAAATLAVNWGQQAVFTALASIAVALIYLAYLGVTVPFLISRLRGRRHGAEDGKDEKGEPLFSLGRLGVPVLIAAVVYQTGMVINLLWPRAEVYDLTGHTWWLRWSALLFLGVLLVVGAALHARTRVRLDGPVELDPIETCATEKEIEAAVEAEADPKPGGSDVAPQVT